MYEGKAESPAIQTATQLLLRPQYWHDRHQGTQSVISHGRTMRPLCEVVSVGSDQNGLSIQKNAIFVSSILAQLYQDINIDDFSDALSSFGNPPCAIDDVKDN